MKNFFVLLLFLVMSFASFSQRGTINVGVNLGFPAFKTTSTTSFVMGLEANYLMESSNNFKYGPSIGVDYYVSKNGLSGFFYLPVAFAARFEYSDKLVLGADLGYGVGVLPKNTTSGFYVRPIIGYSINRTIQLIASFASTSVINTSVFNYDLGILFSL